jgi:hypothetical protein
MITSTNNLSIYLLYYLASNGTVKTSSTSALNLQIFPKFSSFVMVVLWTTWGRSDGLSVLLQALVWYLAQARSLALTLVLTEQKRTDAALDSLSYTSPSSSATFL